MARLTPDNTQRAREVIALYPQPRSALIPVLHIAQEQDGYLTGEAMEHIGELIGLNSAEVRGTATFYDMFFLDPIGKYLLSVCTNIACLLNGGYELLEHVERVLEVKAGGTTTDGVFTVEEVECIALCGNAPCLTANWRFFGDVTPAKFDSLVDDLRMGRLDGVVPPHGTLCRARRSVGLPAAGFNGPAPAAPAASPRPAAAALAPAAAASAAAAPAAPAEPTAPAAAAPAPATTPTPTPTPPPGPEAPTVASAAADTVAPAPTEPAPPVTQPHGSQAPAQEPDEAQPPAQPSKQVAPAAEAPAPPEPEAPPTQAPPPAEPAARPTIQSAPAAQPTIQAPPIVGPSVQAPPPEPPARPTIQATPPTDPADKSQSPPPPAAEPPKQGQP